MEVKLKNKLNADVLDKDFYLLLFNNIVNLKKEADNELCSNKSVQ